jgi:hypothetical protein
MPVKISMEDGERLQEHVWISRMPASPFQADSSRDEVCSSVVTFTITLLS